MIKITEVQIHFIKPYNGMIGFASLVINNSIYLSSIAIHKKLSAEGYRLTYPSKGKFEIFYPINTHCAQRLKKVIDGEQGGISKSVNWQGGGGFRFYELGAAIFDDQGKYFRR